MTSWKAWGEVDLLEVVLLVLPVLDQCLLFVLEPQLLLELLLMLPFLSPLLLLLQHQRDGLRHLQPLMDEPLCSFV